MHDYVVQYLWWYKGKQAVEIEVTLTAAASPAGVLGTDGNTAAARRYPVVNLPADGRIHNISLRGRPMVAPAS